MKTPFFITGGTLATNSPSYVERQADQELYEALLRGEYCYVLTSRQMGKSSLMVRTGLRLREQGVRVALLDLTALGQNLTPEQWYECLAEILGEQLGIEDEVVEAWDQRSGQPPLRRWMSVLQDVVMPGGSADPNPQHEPGDASPLVIFIDEIDAVLSLPFSADEFFAAIRECYNRRSSDPAFQHLTFCLLGVATPSDLIRDVRTTPFNIGRRIELTDFTEGEAQPLVAGFLASASGTSDARRTLRRVLYWTGGHPYLTQRLCRAVVEALPAGNGTATVNTCCRELFLSCQGWERDDNLLFVRDRLLHTGSDLASLLELLGRIGAGREVAPDETNPVLDLLRLAGIIRVGGSPTKRRRSYEIRNRIYAEVFDRDWIQRHMPDAEVRRQRAAFRRGMARASALAGVVLVVMLLLTLTAVDRARVAREAQGEVGRVNGSLRHSLRAQEELNRRLETALDDARKGHAKAARAAQAALAAGQRESEHRKSAESARSAALAARETALDRLSRACIDASTRAASTGDLLGALPPLADALKLDQNNAERAPIHRIRLGYLLREVPRLRDMWNAGSEVRALALSPDGATAAAACDGGIIRVFHLRGGRKARDLTRNAGSVENLAFSPDGLRLASVDQAGVARVWDAKTGRPRTPPLPGLGRLRYLAWHPTGTRLAVGGDNGVVVWGVGPVSRVCEIPFPRAEGCQPAFSPDGRKLAIVAGNHLGWMVDAHSGEPLFRLGRCFIGTSVEFSLDGSTLLLGGAFDNPVRHQGAAILDAETGIVQRYLEMPGLALAMRSSRDGKRLVVGDRLGNVRVWDPHTGSPISPLTHLQQEVTTVSFSRDGRTIIAASRDGLVTVRNALTGVSTCAPLRHGRWVVSAAFSREGRHVITTSRDGAARIWELPPPTGPSGFSGIGMPGPDEEILRVDHLAGDRWAVGELRNRSPAHIGPGKEVRVWDSRTGQLKAPGKWRNYAVAAGGRWLVLAGEAGVQLWDVTAGRTRGPLYPVDVSGAELTLQAHGQWLAALQREPSGSGAALVVDLRTGRVTRIFDQPVATIYGFFDEGRTLWFMAERGAAMLWRAPAAGQQAASASRLALNASGASVRAAASGRTVVTSSPVGVFHTWDGQGRPLARVLRFDDAHLWAADVGISHSSDARRVVLFALGRGGRRNHSVGTLIDLARRKEIRLPGEDTLPMYSAAVFSPSGDRFAAYSQSGEIQVWDANTGRPVTGVMHHSTILNSVSFSPDGRRLLTAAVDGTARVWDATTGRPLIPFLSHPAAVLAASFSPDGRLVLTRSADRSARVWDAHTGEGVVLPLEFGLPVDDCRFLAGSRRVIAYCGPHTVVRDLLPDKRPIPVLERECLLLAAHRADGNGGLQALEPEQLRAVWQTDRD